MWTLIRSVAAVVMLGLPAAALAQPLPDWAARAQIGKPLFVTTTSGERVEGVLGQLSPDGVVVATPAGVRTVPYDEIGKVEKRDSVWSGVAIGTAVGLGIGSLLRANVDCDTRACAAEANALVSGGAFYGAAIGWGIDKALKGRQTLFESRRPASRVFFNIQRDGIGMRAVMTW